MNGAGQQQGCAIGLPAPYPLPRHASPLSPAPFSQPLPLPFSNTAAICLLPTLKPPDFFAFVVIASPLISHSPRAVDGLGHAFSFSRHQPPPAPTLSLFRRTGDAPHPDTSPGTVLPKISCRVHSGKAGPDGSFAPVAAVSLFIKAALRSQWASRGAARAFGRVNSPMLQPGRRHQSRFARLLTGSCLMCLAGRLTKTTKGDDCSPAAAAFSTERFPR